ncbi:MAG: nucleotidyltransferase family protein, partial [Oscillospiraceae bacterium]
MQKFAVAGIVAEYNPFHKGHEWMVQQLRGQGYGAIVCVMSGPLVQRAEPAFLPTPVRAAAALAGGADLVLRLPAAWATASAEAFAAGGVGLLGALGCVDTIAFGAETADAALLWRAAGVLLSPEVPRYLKRHLAGGVSFAAARAAALQEAMPEAAALLQSPNNILGVEYCKALQGAAARQLGALWEKKNGPASAPALPRPLALPRLGASHDGEPQAGVASASWLRRAAAGQNAEALRPWVPAACLPYYTKAQQEGEGIDAARWELAMLARLRGKTAAEFAPYCGGGDGLEARLAAAAGQAVDLPGLYGLAKSKRFAHSRVRRAALGAALGLQRPAAVPPFLQVLAANGQGLAVLQRAKQTAVLPVSTSLAKLAKTGPQAREAVRQEAL